LSNETLFLLEYSESFIYAGLFLILFLCGLGLPIPEELTLLTGGFFVHLGIIRFYPTLAVGFLGILGGDLAIYAIGKKWGQDLLHHPHLSKVITESRLEKGRQFFRDHGEKTVFIARFISGFRVAAFFAAGTMGIKLGRFLLLDFLGALILIPLLLLLGYYFGASIGWLADIITQIDHLLKVLAIAACIAGLVFYLWLRKKPPEGRKIPPKT
jgi:membrane protein DedA with SNARE-associated domain